LAGHKIAGYRNITDSNRRPSDAGAAARETGLPPVTGVLTITKIYPDGNAHPATRSQSARPREAGRRAALADARQGTLAGVPFAAAAESPAQPSPTGKRQDDGQERRDLRGRREEVG
jgi:hypothetical protein